MTTQIRPEIQFFAKMLDVSLSNLEKMLTEENLESWKKREAYEIAEILEQQVREFREHWNDETEQVIEIEYLLNIAVSIFIIIYNMDGLKMIVDYKGTIETVVKPDYH